jgi:hypothetical protein
MIVVSGPNTINIESFQIGLPSQQSIDTFQNRFIINTKIVAQVKYLEPLIPDEKVTQYQKRRMIYISLVEFDPT